MDAMAKKISSYRRMEGRLIRATERVVTGAHDEKAIEPLWIIRLSDVDIVPSPFTIKAMKNLSETMHGSIKHLIKTKREEDIVHLNDCETRKRKSR